MTKYKENEIITGNICGIEKYGAFVDLDDYYKGMIHISQISNNYVKNIKDYLNNGDTIKARVVSVDEEKCRVNLSIKNLNYKVEKVSNNPIKEVGSGFEILKNSLNRWINEEKIKKNEKN